MRCIIQLVSRASVQIEGKEYSNIEAGLLLLVGITDSDQTNDADWLADKICGLRIFPDEEGKMNLSLTDVRGELLIISQFTLYADTKKGNRPSFIRAARPEKAIPLYEYLIKRFNDKSGIQVKTGVFGADMKVSLTNDGPVTIVMDTQNRDF